LLTAWLGNRFRLFLSSEQSDELDDVFARPKPKRLFRLSPDEPAELASAIAAAPRITPAPTLPLPVRDPKDEHVLAAALAANVDDLVTGDNDPSRSPATPASAPSGSSPSSRSWPSSTVTARPNQRKSTVDDTSHR
jgi:hypothetical protein